MPRRWLAVTLVGTGACLARPTGDPGEPWPAPGVVIERALARDLDGDGDLDLALASAADDPAARGVYLLLGGTGFGRTYQTFVATEAAPLALDLADAGGTPEPELAVLIEVAERGQVLLFEGTDLAGFAAAPWTRDVVDLRPSADRRRGVRLLDVDGDDRVDVAAWDRDSLRIGEPARFDATGWFEMPVVQVFGSNSGFFIHLNDVLATGGELVVSVLHTIQRFRVDGSDTYPASLRTEVAAPSEQQNVSTFVDLDGDGVLEVVGLADFDALGAVSLDAAATARAYQAPPNPDVGISGGYRALRVLELDRDPGGRLDLAVLSHFASDFSQPQIHTRVGVLANLRVEGDRLVANAPALISRDWRDTVHPVLEAGDFDGDGVTEVIVVATDGTITCLRPGAAALEDCGL